MPETRVPRFAELAASVAPGQVLVETTAYTEFDFKQSETPVTLDGFGPDEGRVLPGTRLVEVNSEDLLVRLIADGQFHRVVE